MLGGCTELLIDTHLKTPFQSHFFTGHNSRQGFNSHMLSLPSHPHVQLMKPMLYSSQNDLQVCLQPEEELFTQMNLSFQPTLVMEGFLE